VSLVSDDILAQLTETYLGSTLDRLARIDQRIDDIYNERGNRDEIYVDLQKEIHSLKGSAGSYGFQSITTITHRLEDYMESISRLEPSQWLEVQKFIDDVRSIVEAGNEVSEAQLDQILASLPKSALKFAGNEKLNGLRAILVMDSGVQRKIVGTELAEKGIDISFSSSPTEALDLAFKIKPDLVLCSQEFPNITGAEFSNMLRCIDKFEATKFVLLTSSSNSSVEELGAAADAGIIHKDSNVIENIVAFINAT